MDHASIFALKMTLLLLTTHQLFGGLFPPFIYTPETHPPCVSINIFHLRRRSGIFWMGPSQKSLPHPTKEWAKSCFNNSPLSRRGAHLLASSFLWLSFWPEIEAEAKRAGSPPPPPRSLLRFFTLLLSNIFCVFLLLCLCACAWQV